MKKGNTAASRPKSKRNTGTKTGESRFKSEENEKPVYKSKSSKGSSRDASKGSPKGSPRDASKGSLKGSSRDASMGSPKGSSKNTSKGSSKDSSKGSSKVSAYSRKRSDASRRPQLNKDQKSLETHFVTKCYEMDYEGKGIVKNGKDSYSVPNLLIDEVAKFEIIRRGRKPSVKIVEMIKTSPKRIAPLCDVSDSCGGCQLQHLSYKGQLEYKQNTVVKLLGQFGKVSPIIGMKNPDHYRNKVHASFSADTRGKIVSGIYEEESHRVISINNCKIQDERANQIINSIREMMPSFKMKPYDEDSERGFLRHVLIRTGHKSGEVMVVLVVGSPIFPARNHFVKKLIERHPEITTIVQNLNNRRTSMVLGDRETVLYGKGYIEDTLCDTIFRISAKSFYQINSVQTEVLYGEAIKMAKLKGDEIVLDAYSGIGTISLIVSQSVQHVTGVELNRDAVRDAIANAKRNHIDNVRFNHGDAGEFLLGVAREKEHLDVVFMDPPRSGSDDAFLEALKVLKPNKIVYISCNPVTLARDLNKLTGSGYKVSGIQPVDMFPGTMHVEVVCEIVRNNKGFED